MSKQVGEPSGSHLPRCHYRIPILPSGGTPLYPLVCEFECPGRSLEQGDESSGTAS